MNRAERRRRAREDETLLAQGVDPESQNPEQTAAMARQLHALFEQAKRERNIDPAVRYLHAKIDATLNNLAHIPVGCGKGCAHCCHIWVSATAPEVLFIAKALRRKRDTVTAERIAAAHRTTKDFDFESRGRHPHPCPLLADNLCSIYAMRPRACRFASSADAAVCARAYIELANEDIPMPKLHLVASNAYALALAIALKHAQLPYHLYEFHAALARAMERESAEREWLAGNDIFSDVRRDPNDVFMHSPAHIIYGHAFGA